MRMADTNTINLWPEFDLSETALSSPKEVIAKAGAGLKDKTKGLVVFYPMRTTVSADRIELVFSLWVAALSYHYPFLNAQFPIKTLYPVQLVVDKFPAPFTAVDEPGLIAALTLVFNADATKETIQHLISLSR
jgi:hypothetical protein